MPSRETAIGLVSTYPNFPVGQTITQKVGQNITCIKLITKLQSQFFYWE